MYIVNGLNVARWGFTGDLNSGLISTWGFSEWAPPSVPISWSSDEVINLLIEQFEDRPNIVALVKVLINQLVDLEIMMALLFSCRNLDSITGILLDYAGNIVGVKRNGLNDTEYRNLIKVWIFLNKSSGEPEVLIAALKLFTSATKVHYREVYPAKVLLEYSSPFTPSLTLQSDMQRLALGGVQIILSWNIDGDPDFGFADENGFEDYGVLGLGETDFPLEGGKLIEKI